MWKIIVAFIIFAALAMFVVMKGGDKLDMGGEKHGSEAVHAPEAPASAAAPAASAPEAAASAVAPASAAK
jgi:hypothetical protein